MTKKLRESSKNYCLEIIKDILKNKKNFCFFLNAWYQKEFWKNLMRKIFIFFFSPKSAPFTPTLSKLWIFLKNVNNHLYSLPSSTIQINLINKFRKEKKILCTKITHFQICWAVRASMAWKNHLEISSIFRSSDDKKQFV